MSVVRSRWAALALVVLAGPLAAQQVELKDLTQDLIRAKAKTYLQQQTVVAKLVPYVAMITVKDDQILYEVVEGVPTKLEWRYQPLVGYNTQKEVEIHALLRGMLLEVLSTYGGGLVTEKDAQFLLKRTTFAVLPPLAGPVDAPKPPVVPVEPPVKTPAAKPPVVAVPPAAKTPAATVEGYRITPGSSAVVDVVGSYYPYSYSGSWPCGCGYSYGSYWNASTYSIPYTSYYSTAWYYPATWYSTAWYYPYRSYTYPWSAWYSWYPWYPSYYAYPYWGWGWGGYWWQSSWWANSWWNYPTYPVYYRVFAQTPTTKRANVLIAANTTADSLYREALTKFWDRDAASAVELLTAAAERKLDDARIWSFKALAERQLGDTEASLESAVRAAALQMINPVGRTEMGLALERVQGADRQFPRAAKTDDLTMDKARAIVAAPVRSKNVAVAKR